MIYNSPFPEEFNRQAVSIIADLNFAPTEASRQNLINEGKSKDTIFVTGNTAIDALKTTVQKNYHNIYLDWAQGSRLITLTAHRRENLGEQMRNMFYAIREIVEEFKDIKVLYPIHMNPTIRAIAQEILEGDKRIRLIEPLDVITFHNIMAISYLILTDSGGIQEEAPSLGKPVLVMRNNAERPEGIQAGTLKLVGTAREGIYNAFKELLDNKDIYNKMIYATNPYGDGFACEKIVDIIAATI